MLNPADGGRGAGEDAAARQRSVLTRIGDGARKVLSEAAGFLGIPMGRTQLGYIGDDQQVTLLRSDAEMEGQTKTTQVLKTIEQLLGATAVMGSRAKPAAGIRVNIFKEDSMAAFEERGILFTAGGAKARRMKVVRTRSRREAHRRGGGRRRGRGGGKSVVLYRKGGGGRRRPTHAESRPAPRQCSVVFSPIPRRP